MDNQVYERNPIPEPSKLRATDERATNETNLGGSLPIASKSPRWSGDHRQKAQCTLIDGRFVVGRLLEGWRVGPVTKQLLDGQRLGLVIATEGGSRVLNMTSEFDSTPMTKAEKMALYRDALGDAQSPEEVEVLAKEMRNGGHLTETEIESVLARDD